MNHENNGRVKLRVRSFSRSLPIALLSSRETVMGRFRSILRSFQVTEQQWRVLRTLRSVDALEVLELAEATCLLAPSLSRILSDLEGRNLVSRKSVPKDLRRSQISITSSGMDLVDAMEPYSETVYTEIISTFGKERMDQLLMLLKDLTQSLQALPHLEHDLAKHMNDNHRRISTPPRGRPKRNSENYTA